MKDIGNETGISKKEERLLALESWLAMEERHGDAEKIAEARKKLPKRVKKRRKLKVVN